MNSLDSTPQQVHFLFWQIAITEQFCLLVVERLILVSFKKCTEYHSKEMPTQTDETETNQEV